MKIKMDSLVITEYCSTDKRKYRFIKEISEDPLVNYFVSRTMEELLEDSEGLDKLYVGPAYIIEEQRKLVGLIRLAFLDGDGVLNLHYAVHPDYRRKHYGTKILTEISKYLFKNMLSVSKIELYIKEMNTGSIKCAENAKFKFDRDFKPVKCDCTVKIYSLKK